MLVDNRLRARLVDFGRANFADTHDNSGSSAVPGADRCAAPEILKPSLIERASPRHTPASDMYSFGQVAWQVSQKQRCRYVTDKGRRSTPGLYL